MSSNRFEAVQYFNATSPELHKFATSAMTSAHPLGFPMPCSRVLAYISPPDGSIRKPLHPYHEKHELIATSVRLSNFDLPTSTLIRTIFDEDEDPQYVEQ